MKKERFLLAQEYEAQIKRIRKELIKFDKVTHMSLKCPYNMGIEYKPSIERNLDEFPRLKAYIKSALEEELKEYEGKFNNL